MAKSESTIIAKVWAVDGGVNFRKAFYTLEPLGVPRKHSDVPFAAIKKIKVRDGFTFTLYETPDFDGKSRTVRGPKKVELDFYATSLRIKRTNTADVVTEAAESATHRVLGRSLTDQERQALKALGLLFGVLYILNLLT